MPRAPTSGWNSSATGCWAWSWPRSCTRFIRDDAEGALALKFNALVRGEACARAAEAAGLADHLILASPEAAAAAARKAAILGGACEAVIAALYLDGGMAAARGFIERYWAEHVRRARPGREMRDAKTRLQEWAQGARALPAPVYTRDRRATAPTMRRVSRSKRRWTAMTPETGEGGSKREAEQDAAAKLLAQVGLP